ncbi:uncharacterized protein B0H18DRAFT_933743, partial [Fomitopsis serialis]|uniref:uncharacterized protein n=1 Tax=Fomitopsis serialis TaxID=139415 RepID=UPI00200755D7
TFVVHHRQVRLRRLSAGRSIKCICCRPRAARQDVDPVHHPRVPSLLSLYFILFLLQDSTFGRSECCLLFNQSNPFAKPPLQTRWSRSARGFVSWHVCSSIFPIADPHKDSLF